MICATVAAWTHSRSVSQRFLEERSPAWLRVARPPPKPVAPRSSQAPSNSRSPGRPLPGARDALSRYTVESQGGKPAIRPEADLRAIAPREGPIEQLSGGRWGSPADFLLRAEVVRLDLERRADALGALFASRVYVK